MCESFFFLLLVLWILYNLCILYVKLVFFCVLSSQYFEKYLSVVLSFFLCCACFVTAAYICIFCIFITYSTSYCCHYKFYGSTEFTRMYPKVSELAAWSENCKWYSSLPLGANCIAIL
jgi:hypothetical protein